MKKLIVLGLLAITALSSAYAQRSNDQRTRTRSGVEIVRIVVGSDRDDRDQEAMSRRIRRLEQAVSEMQNKIYDLEANDTPRTRPVDMYVCSLDSDKYIGKAQTEVEAKSIAVKNCERNRGRMCDSFFAKCVRTVEYVNY